MFTKKGKGPQAVTPLGCALAAAIVAGSAQAALVTVSGVITNNTDGVQIYQFSQKVKVTEFIANAAVFGSMSFTVADFNRDGATLESDSGKLYSGFMAGSLAKAFLPLTAPTSFKMTAPARSMVSYTGTFGSAAAPETLPGRSLNVNDEIEIRLNFRLSAGDQATYTGSFNIVNAVPGPGAACAAMLAPWIGLHRRRRTENDR
jgi:hypothetical protein